MLGQGYRHTADYEACAANRNLVPKRQTKLATKSYLLPTRIRGLRLLLVGRGLLVVGLQPLSC
jgi:hypothetical protein